MQSVHLAISLIVQHPLQVQVFAAFFFFLGQTQTVIRHRLYDRSKGHKVEIPIFGSKTSSPVTVYPASEQAPHLSQQSILSFPFALSFRPFRFPPDPPPPSPSTSCRPQKSQEAMTLDGGKGGGWKESRQMGRNAGLFGVIAVSILFSCIGDRGFRRETLGVRSGHEGLADGLGPARQQWSGGRRRRLAATSEWNPSFQARNRLKVGSFTLRGGSSDEWNGDEDASSDDLALDRRMRTGTNVNVDRDGIEWGGEVEIRDDKEDTSRIERELRRRDKVDVFCRKTGLNVGVAKTLLMQVRGNQKRVNLNCANSRILHLHLRALFIQSHPQRFGVMCACML